MNGRVEQDAQAAAQAGAIALTGTPAPLALTAIDFDDRWGGHSLPNDHPAWMKDTLSISQRARALIANLKPIALKVYAFWEHRVRSVVIGNERVSIDASGSYRLT